MKKSIKYLLLFILMLTILFFNDKSVYAAETLDCVYGTPSMNSFATKISQDNDGWIIYIKELGANGWQAIYYNNYSRVNNVQIKVGATQGVLHDVIVGGIINTDYYEAKSFKYCPSGLNAIVSDTTGGIRLTFTFNNSNNNLVSGKTSQEYYDDLINNGETTKLDYANLCSLGNVGIIKAVRIIGRVVSICKWIVPMLIILFGMIDFGKAVISNDDKAMGKATKSLITRIIIGMAVGLLPTVILSILGLLETLGAKDIYKNSFGACTKCILDVDNCGSKNTVNIPNNTPRPSLWDDNGFLNNLK